MRLTIKHVKLIFIIICFAVFALFSSFININSQANSERNTNNWSRELPGPGISLLNDPETKNSIFAGDKGTVPFNHNQHISKRAGLNCVTCHHTNSKSLTAAVEEPVAKCTTCHLADDSTCAIEGTNEEVKFKGKRAINSKDAYHGYGDGILSCLGCHKENDIYPTGCNECHSNSNEINYTVKPAFPSIKFEIHQNSQTVQVNPNPNWRNTYSYTPNHPPQNYYPQRYWGGTNNAQNTDVTVNNYIPNTVSSVSSVPPQEKTQVIEKVIVEPEKNYDYLLEDRKPTREVIREIYIESGKENDKAVATPSTATPAAIMPSITMASENESMLDKILSHTNKVFILIVIVLYFDLRRRLNS